MGDYIFTSPGVKFKERDLTFVTKNIGITTLGLVGETMKGPAFEPIYIQDKREFQSIFGYQNITKFSNGTLQYQLPYVANSYLNESNQLWVTRVLGISGYDAWKAWGVTVNSGLDPNTIVSGTTNVYSDTFTDYQYLGNNISGINSTGVVFSGFKKYNNVFSGTSYNYIVTGYTASTGSGHVSVTASTFTGYEYSDYKNMVIAKIRTRGYVKDNINSKSEFIKNTNNIYISGNTTNIDNGNFFGNFTLNAIYNGGVKSYNVSINPNSSNFISNVIGSTSKDKNTIIWCESIYPDLIKKIDSYGEYYPSSLNVYGISGISPYAIGINNDLLVCDSDVFTNYKTQYKTPETPWLVSQIKGNVVNRMFKCISISDGDSANSEIKISIQNINLETNEFDIVIRDFNDTDNNITILEQFSKCNMTKSSSNFIGKKIGTIDGEYSLSSKYIMIELSDEYSENDFPCGFEGYLFNNYNSNITKSGSTLNTIVGKTPKIFYKTKYSTTDKINKTYLGISERGYDGDDLVGTGINQNYFNFNGIVGDETHTKTNGFHLDINANNIISNGYGFDTGNGSIKTLEDVLYDNTSAYYNINTRKFTLVPYGGFDGWDIYRLNRSYGDNYRANGIYDGVNVNENPTNDFQAWEIAINTFSNPEEITINLFATPGINWASENVLIQNTIEMIETLRTDSLYIIDSPDINVTTTIGDNGKSDIIAAEEIVDLINSANIDSSYACTYFPMIQIKDNQNNVNIYIPPTCEVVRSIAYTDNTSFTWFAPAGLNRGVINANKSKYKLSQAARDILYSKGNINPIADFSNTGTAIFGQKTLKKSETSLSRINIRRLLLQTKLLISNISTRLLFEQNDNTTIDQFKSKVNPILETIKRERGLYDFYIVMDDTINNATTRDRNELYGEIYLKATSSLEYIGIGFNITPSGASFNDL